MRYDNPELRERLAAEYVLGTMPARVRRRFQQLIAADPGLARIVGGWADRLLPLDQTIPAAQPPARVWRAIEHRIAGEVVLSATPAADFSWLRSLALWRALAIGAGAAVAGLVFYIVVLAGYAPPPTVVAILGAHGGEPGWVAVTGPRSGQVTFAAVEPQTEPARHDFELWAVAGGPPRPLGLLPQQPGTTATLRLAQLPPRGGVLAVSLEPPGGSATGSPTGPVLYQGKVLTGSP